MGGRNGRRAATSPKVTKNDFTAIINQQDALIKRILVKLAEQEHTIHTVAGYAQADIEILDARQKTFRGQERFFNRYQHATDEDWKKLFELAHSELFIEGRARTIREQENEKALRELVSDFDDKTIATPTSMDQYNEAKAELSIIDAARDVKELVILRQKSEMLSEQAVKCIAEAQPIPPKVSLAQAQTKARIAELEGKSDDRVRGEVLQDDDSEGRGLPSEEVRVPSEDTPDAEGGDSVLLSKARSGDGVAEEGSQDGGPKEDEGRN